MTRSQKAQDRENERQAQINEEERKAQIGGFWVDKHTFPDRV